MKQNRRNEPFAWNHWDYLAMLGLGVILVIFTPEIKNFWSLDPPPPPDVKTIISLKQLIIGFRNNWVIPTAMFVSLSVIVYAGVKGAGRFLRAIRLSCFVAIVVCFVFDAHYTLEPLSAFGLAVAKSTWLCLVIPIIVLALMIVAGRVFKSFHSLKPILLPLLVSIEFFSVGMVGAAIRNWLEIYFFGIVGGYASVWQASIEMEKQSPEQKKKDPLAYLAGLLIGFAVYAAIALTCWTFLLAKWNIIVAW